eukprot:5612154-Pleurochrysis_carterae.AAC.1
MKEEESATGRRVWRRRREEEKRRLAATPGGAGASRQGNCMQLESLRDRRIAMCIRMESAAIVDACLRSGCARDVTPPRRAQDPHLLVGGSYNGLVSYWDTRKGSNPAG